MVRTKRLFRKNFFSSIKSFGNVWANFQQALDNEGCSYWGRLYENIFENSLKLDDRTTEREN